MIDPPGFIASKSEVTLVDAGVGYARAELDSLAWRIPMYRRWASDIVPLMEDSQRRLQDWLAAHE